MSDKNLFAQQTSNRRKSAWLVAGFLLFFAWIGFGGDLVLYLNTRDAFDGRYHHVIPWIGLVACSFAALSARYAWMNGAKRVLDASGAQEVINPVTPELKQLDNVVEEMSIAAGIPKPKVWIIHEDDPNAFATGRDPEHANIAVTEGLLKILDRDELQGVIAHEMSHIRNFDIRLMTLLAAMVGAIALMSEVMGRFLGYTGRRGRGRSSSKGGGALGLVLLVLWVISLLIAPIVSTILTMSVSRKREYLADATGAQLTRNPLSLARALEKIEAQPGATKAIGKGSTHLCIVNPGAMKLASGEGFVSNLFASHPPMGRRLERLRGMGYIPPVA